MQREGERMHSRSIDRAAVAEFMLSIVRDPDLCMGETVGLAGRRRETFSGFAEGSRWIASAARWL